VKPRRQFICWPGVDEWRNCPPGMLTVLLQREHSDPMPVGVRARSTRRVIVAVGCVIALIGCSPSRPARTAADPLATAIASALGADPVGDHVRAIIVTVDGRTRFEHYYSASADQYRSSFSVTKSVMSTLVGIAIGEGRLRLDERLPQLLPRYASQMKPSVARVTLRELLTATAGFTDTWNGQGMDELQAAPNWIQYILKHQDTAPGAEFHYSDYGAHLLSPILVHATGQSVLAYARSRLFGPLGIVTTPAFTGSYGVAHLAAYQKAAFAWPVDPQGFSLGYSWIKLRPRDMAAFGQLFLQAGQWNGRQVVPADWVRQATTAQAGERFSTFVPFGSFAPENYGYLWWVTKADGAPAYFALGYGGQLVEVVPQRRMVIVVSSDVDLSQASAPVVGPNDLQQLVTAIIATIATGTGG
jgi:CubicO group peptidase (beta-lactamase class C family)